MAFLGEIWRKCGGISENGGEKVAILGSEKNWGGAKSGVFWTKFWRPLEKNYGSPACNVFVMLACTPYTECMKPSSFSLEI